MNLKASFKALGAIIWHNRALIEEIVGGTMVVAGTVVNMTKAKEAAEVSYNVEGLFDDIHYNDQVNGWESKKERSVAVRHAVGFAVKGYTKAYWLGTTLVIGGEVLQGIGFGTEHKDLVATSAALATTSAAFSAYRQRVVVDQGEAKDQEYLLGPQATTVDILPDGTVVQTTTPVENNNRKANLPPFCFMFDSSNDNWEPEAFKNRDFLEDHQRYLNHRLDHEGFLFTNDILRDLGMPLVKTGWTSGILKTYVDENGNRFDNILSLGLNAQNPAAQRFRDGIEPNILIQLNVEPNIIDKLHLPLM